MNRLPFEKTSRKTAFYSRPLGHPGSLFLHGVVAYAMTQTPETPTEQEEIWMEMTVVEQPEPPLPHHQSPNQNQKSRNQNQKRKRYSSKTFRQRWSPHQNHPTRKEEGQTRSRLECQLICRRRWHQPQCPSRNHLVHKGVGDEKLSIDEAAESTAISYAAATKQPKLKKRPPLDIPDAVKEEGIEGTVKITIDIDSTGAVVATALVSSLHPEADKACLESWKKAKFQPAEQAGEAVTVRGFPRRCRFKALD